LFALDTVAKAEFAIVPGVISALTINELDKLPDVLLCTTPAMPNASMLTTPVGEIFIRSEPLVSNERVFAVAAESPVLVLPLNCNDGDAAEPAGNTKLPVNVPPERFNLLLSCVCIEEVTPDRKPSSVAVTALETS